MATWVLEKDVFAHSCFDEMVEHFKENGIKYHVVRVKPFVHEIEGDIPSIEGPCVIYGSIGVQKLAISNGWNPGVWKSDDMDELVLARVLGEYYLNHDLICTKFKDVGKFVVGEFFIKPNGDTKEFAGFVTNLEEFNGWTTNMLEIGYVENSIFDLDVVISQPKKIGCEWRLVIVNKKVAAFSIYRQWQAVMPKRECPPEVIDFANSVVQKHSPTDVYVMDICEAEDGYKVIEYNTFNSAGLYACDVGAIIDSIEDLLKTS